MTRNPSELEQAVSRTLRDSLQKLQRTAEELDHAMNDLVSACASTRPSNALSPVMRAQGAAASLAASLEVLSRLVMGSLQPAAPVISEGAMESQPRETATEFAASNMVEEGAPASIADPVPAEPARFEAAAVEPVQAMDVVLPAPEFADVPQDVPQYAGVQSGDVQSGDVQVTPDANDFSQPSDAPPPSMEGTGGFDVSALVPEERELHRRADRVAKVAMQDIKMLRPDQVSLGRERKDLCSRLGDDIERARKEYDRRFQTILGHPVDYFYDRMVEILGGGDPETLGEYPYPSHALRR
jgi:hypothetical protein